MATELYGLSELTSAQANKFVTYNRNLRQLEAGTRVESRTNGGPPVSSSTGDAFIVDVLSGDWSSFALNDIVFDDGGIWRKLDITAASEGLRVWVKDEDIVVVYSGSAWIAQAANDLGVSALTDNSVPFVSGDTLMEDVNFNYDPGTDTLTVPNLVVTSNLTSIQTTNLEVSDAIISLAEGNATDTLDIGLIGERLTSNIAMFYDESADEWAFATTSSTSSDSTIVITDYSDLHIGGLTVDDNQTIGGTLGVIGTTTLGDSLTINKSSGNTEVILNQSLSTGTSYFQVVNNAASSGVFRCWGSGSAGTRFGVSEANLVGFYTSGASVSGFAVGTANSSPVIFGTNNSERGRFTPTGDLLIGSTSSVGTNKLQVTGNAYVSGNLGVGVGTTFDKFNILADASAASAHSDLAVLIPDTVGNRAGFGFRTSSGGALGGIVAEIITGGVFPNVTGRLEFIVQNLSSSLVTTRFSPPAAGETALWVYDADNATLERVTVGAADSGGVGFKVLRIPN